jgi:cell division protein FtsX
MGGGLKERGGASSLPEEDTMTNKMTSRLNAGVSAMSLTMSALLVFAVALLIVGGILVTALE